MEPVAPSPSRHQAPGELVDDHDLAVLDHVVDVEPEDGVRAQRLLDMVLDVRVLHVVQVAAVQAMRQVSFGRPPCRFRSTSRSCASRRRCSRRLLERFAIFGLGVALGFRARLQLRDDAIDFVVEIGRRFSGS